MSGFDKSVFSHDQSSDTTGPPRNGAMRRFDEITTQQSGLERTSASGAVERMLAIDGEARGLTPKRDVSWRQLLFPSATQRAQRAGETKMAESEMEYRLRTLQVMRGVELKLMEDALNGVRVQHAAKLRGHMAENLQQELNRVLATFGREFDAFNANVVAQIERAEGLPYEQLRDLEYRRIHRQIEAFHRVSEQLVENFEQIVKEHVHA